MDMASENNQIGFWDWNLKSNVMFNDIAYTQILGYGQAEFNCNFKL